MRWLFEKPERLWILLPIALLTLAVLRIEYPQSKWLFLALMTVLVIGIAKNAYLLGQKSRTPPG